MKLALALVVVVSACNGSKRSDVGSASAGSGAGSAGSASGSAASAREVPAPPATGPSLRATLAKAAGDKPVLLALDDHGQLIARSIDGSFMQTLAPGPYGAALLDDARELVWLRGDVSLDVVDLRAPAPARAKALISIDPPKAMEKLGEDITEPPRWTMSDYVILMLSTSCGVKSGLKLEWSSGGVGALRGAERIKVVAKDWFAAEEHRTPRADLPAPFSAERGHVKLRDRGKCKGESANECGTAVAFGATGKQLVEDAIDVEHCPAQHCVLRDEKTGQFAPVPGASTDEQDETCGPYRFDPSGTSYLVDDNVCGADGACRSVGTDAIGWLDGSRTVWLE